MKNNKKSINLNSYGKINLFLEILGKRDDGFHEIVTVMQTIGLADKIRIRESSNNAVLVECPSNEAGQGKKNLAYKAVELLLNYLKTKVGVVVEIKKNIPVAAGLGGGSSNAATTLLGLNEMWHLKLKDEELSHLASQIGADVPFFLKGGLAVARGKGENLTFVNRVGKIYFILAAPRLKIRSKWAYDEFDSIYPNWRRDGAKQGEELASKLKKGDFKSVGNLIFNRLEEVSVRKHPVILKLKDLFAEAGCEGAAMTGSGPVVFGLCQSRKEALLASQRIEKCTPKLGNKFLGKFHNGKEVVVVESTLRGVPHIF